MPVRLLRFLGALAGCLLVVPAAAAGFDGDFSRGLGIWPVRIHEERITLQDDPVLGPQRRVARFAVRDHDTGPTENPRAQLEGERELRAGRTYWVGWSTYFPRSFPRLPSNAFLTFEAVYGDPSRGAGPLATSVHGDSIQWMRNEAHDYDVPWSMPLRRGRWIDFAWRVHLSRSARKGSVEIRVNAGNGWKRQRFANGRTRMRMRTLDASNGGGPNSFRLSNYRTRGIFPTVTLLHASPRVGRSFAAVAPSSYR